MRVFDTDAGLNITPAPGSGYTSVGFSNGFSSATKLSIYMDKVVFEDTGNVGIGTYDPTEQLDVSGTARLRGIDAGSGTTVVADADGKLWKESSSRKYKTDIRDLPTQTEAVLDLQPVAFRWVTTGNEEIGLIAEDVAATLPELVLCDAGGQPDAVKYDKLSLYLLDVVKAQRAEITAQQSELAKLRARLEKIETLLGDNNAPRSGGVR